MIIFNDDNKPIMLESLYEPIPSDYYWVLNLDAQDFMLTNFNMIEEITSPVVHVNVLGFVFPIPTTWHVLIYAEETGQVDIVDAGSLCTNQFSVLIAGPDIAVPQSAPIKVIDYSPMETVITPAVSKQNLLCHAINETMWINVTPCDTYNRYFKDLHVSDIFTY